MALVSGPVAWLHALRQVTGAMAGDFYSPPPEKLFKWAESLQEVSESMYSEANRRGYPPPSAPKKRRKKP